MSLTRRRYGAFQELRDQVARESLAGLKTGLLSRKYGVAPSTIRKWVKDLKDREGVDCIPSVNEHIAASKRVTELEANQERLIKALGEKELEIAILLDLLKKRTKP